MKAYKFYIWHAGTDEKGNFTGNIERTQIIHAHNEKAAKQKVDLDMTLEEWIYRVECLGVVRKVIETRYEYTPLKKR